jgi:3-deoxy-manno-octulosonate cytidylyltransferase (CMP-KDO synthetase)
LVLKICSNSAISAKGYVMSESPKVTIVIPARYASTRLPGKPLVPLAGKPMIQRVYERAILSKRTARVMVATDDERIVKAVEAFGGEARMTRPDHRTGTERVAEVAAHEEGDIFVNVQGDEPLIDPASIDAAVDALTEASCSDVSTIVTAIRKPGDIMDPNVVKVVLDFNECAIYFSRAPIPWVRDSGVKAHAKHWKHLGLYAFQRSALVEFPTLPQGELERIEQLEQLRWLENGWKISVAVVEHDAVSVDVPDDVARVEQLLEAHP